MARRMGRRLSLLIVVAALPLALWAVLPLGSSGQSADSLQRQIERGGHDEAAVVDGLLAELARPADVLIAISSSGKSANIRNAASCVSGKGGSVITLSGFDARNPLRALGDLNIWVDSTDYGFVEIAHQFILHNVADRFGRELAGQPGEPGFELRTAPK